MAASVFDSALFGRLFPVGEVGRLFSDTAEIRAMLVVEGALAQVQGRLGVIPHDSASAIHRAARDVQIDPAALAEATGHNGVSVPALVAAFRAEMQAPEHAQYVHWGATSQDIIDTALMLRLRQALVLIEADLTAVLRDLADLAETHAGLPMAARTYGQHATPTSFGAHVAEWGAPLLECLTALETLRNLLWVSAAGAAGTGAAYGDVTATRAGLAEVLDLRDPGRSWHTDRTPLRRLTGWCVDVTIALAKMGEDLTALVQSGIGEVTLGGGGASSTMPQKQNPVAPSALVALGAFTQSLSGAIAQPHVHQRDGAAWFTEWLTLPQIVLATASSVTGARGLCRGIAPNKKAMARAFDSGLIHAEALSFALASQMSRPEAQAATKALVRAASDGGVPLGAAAAAQWPDLDTDALFDPGQQMGSALRTAHDFARRVRALIGQDAS